MSKKFLDLDGLSHFWLLVKNKLSGKVDKEYKTGSTSAYKVLSDNNLTDELVTKIQNAGDSSFSGNYEDLVGKPELATVATSGSYNDLSDKPTIPTDNNQLTNGAGYQTSAEVQSAITTEMNKLSTVATSGSYNDLADKPTLSTVATSGSYNDLEDKPTIPTDNNQLTNGAGYQTSAQVQSAITTALGDITGIDFQIVTELPSTGVKGTIYLMSNSGSNPNAYDEYVYVNSTWEKIGTTEVDLSGYVQDSDLVAITNTEIDETCV